MASDTKNVKLGVCTVTFDETDLGYTKGGVEVEVTTETHQVTVDQFGNSPINEYVMGRTVTVTCPLAETTLENLVAIMPGATLVTDATDTTKKKVVVTNGIGASLLETAKKLILHPVGKAANDRSDDFVIPLANTAGALQFAYKLDEERIFNVSFSGYPDPVTKVLYVVGDESAAAT
ncbi:hypothetical protein [Azospirillum argentinense]|uniref:hypothetical protein n=1 Tax=Azospirillum argentinense TaxID=2970906 RepID=UPI0032DF3764